MPIEDVLRVWYCIAVHKIPEERETTTEVLQACYGLAVYFTPARSNGENDLSAGFAHRPLEATNSTIANCE
jgi:hypothetical protein